MSDDKVKNRIVRLAARMTVGEIASEVGLSQTHVRHILRAAGAKAKSAMHSPLADLRKVLRVMIANDYSYEKTAKHFGVSTQAVYQRIPAKRLKHGGE